MNIKKQLRTFFVLFMVSVYMHCCWGWPRGRCNGYYLSKVFDLRNGAIELSNKDIPGTKDFDFDVLYRMVTYDKPVK